MIDDALREFERALAIRDHATMERLGPMILARARGAADLTAPERERERVEERKRIGERILGLQALGLTVAGEAWAWVGREDATLGAMLLSGRTPPDPGSFLVRVTNAEGRKMLDAPLTEVPGGIEDRALFAFVDGRVPDAANCTIRLVCDGKVLMTRGPRTKASLPIARPGEPACRMCGAFLGFSARQRGVCGPCSRESRPIADPPRDPICSRCGGRQGYPNSMTHHGAPHPCRCR